MEFSEQEKYDVVEAHLNDIPLSSVLNEKAVINIYRQFGKEEFDEKKFDRLVKEMSNHTTGNSESFCETFAAIIVMDEILQSIDISDYLLGNYATAIPAAHEMKREEKVQKAIPEMAVFFHDMRRRERDEKHWLLALIVTMGLEISALEALNRSLWVYEKEKP